jgi:hypothetical protein
MWAARVLGALVLLGWVADCTVATGVRTLGGDLHAASGRSPWGSAGILIAQHDAFEQAQAFCAGQHLRLLLAGDHASRGGYTLQFRCVQPDSPELARPAVNQQHDHLL